MKATDVLPDAQLEFSFPASILEASALCDRLGIRARHARLNPSKTTAHATVATEAWEWETEEVEVDTRDEDGNADTIKIETRVELSINSNYVQRMRTNQQVLGLELRALGIPYDSLFKDGMGGEDIAEHARIDSQNPTGPTILCDSARERVDIDEMVWKVATAKANGNFDDLIPWLESLQKGPAPLEADAKAFNARFAKDGAKHYFDAAGRAFALESSRTAWLSANKPIEWSQSLTEDFKATFEGSTLLERISSRAVPMRPQHLADLIATGLSTTQPPVDVLTQAFDAFCSTCALLARQAKAKDAIFCGKAIENQPLFASSLSKNAKAFFELPLDLAGLPSDQAALAEAYWLRAQCAISKPMAPTRAKAKSI